MDTLPTLSELLVHAIGVKVYCGPCNRAKFISGNDALELFGPEANVLQIAARSRCATCGAKAQESRPAFPDWQEEIRRKNESDLRKTARADKPRGE